MSRLGGVLRLVRPVNAVMAFLAVISGAATVTKAFLGQEVLLGAISASLILMSGNAVNDVFDLEADRINRPDRPLPRGDLSVNQALGISLVLSGLALALAFCINIRCVLVAVFYAAAFFAYAIWLKPTGLLGNILVSSGTGMSVIYGSLTVDWLLPLTVIFAVSAFMLNLGREIVKGVEDLIGDRIRNCRTIAISHGPRVAGFAVTILYATLLPISVAPFLLGYTGLAYMVAIFIVDLIVVAVIRQSTVLRADNAGEISKLIKISMALGIVAFFVGAIMR
jgi:geranylgeranylglycerol-phosphate geranylgeranyltransferase